jgi:uroporphyrinogen decarboxylase
MTSRERVGKALRHQQPDRVPIHEAFWEATTNRWRQEGLPPDVSPDDYFDTEIRTISVDNSFGLPTEVVERTDEYVTVRDNWGVLKRDWLDHRSTPELLDFPIKSRAQWDEMKGCLEPDPHRIDWAGIEQAHARYREQGKFVCISAIPGYEATWRKIGPEALLVAIAEDPEWVEEMYAYDAELIIGLTKLYLERGLDFDGAWLWDDLGYRNALLFSPRAYREQLFPYHKQVSDFFHQQGWPVVLHSCGRVSQIVPMLIEAGFDCLQPLEVKAGMDLGELVREYGRDLCFMGGVDVRTFFAEDEAELERELLGKLRVGMSNPGGYIFHSDHSIPTQVSFQRYAKVAELVRKHGLYR